jgi:methylmalonyl-CoA epimerase
VFAVNKVDREGADRLVAAVDGALALRQWAEGEWRPPVVRTQATTGAGVQELLDRALARRRHDAARAAARRRERAGARLRDVLARRLLAHVESQVRRRAVRAVVDRMDRRARPCTAAGDLARRCPRAAALDARRRTTDQRYEAHLDHVGIAVDDLAAALAFFQDALGLEVRAPEEVAGQRVRAHVVPVGGPALELLEATAPESPIARFLARRGPGLHHITLCVDDLGAAIEHLVGRGVRLIDRQPRPGAEGALVAFVHPSSAHGVLVELKQPAPPPQAGEAVPSGHGRGAPSPAAPVTWPRGLRRPRPVSLSDGFFSLDGGAMFGVVPKALWERRAPADARNRIRLGLRPLVVRGARTLIVDAGIGDKMPPKLADIYGIDRQRQLDHALAEAGLSVEDQYRAGLPPFDPRAGSRARQARKPDTRAQSSRREGGGLCAATRPTAPAPGRLQALATPASGARGRDATMYRVGSADRRPTARNQ